VGKEEMQALVNALTVNETYFFRDDAQFKILVTDLLPQIVKRMGASRTIKIWSCPCSSGEEPYTIALALLETWRDIDRYEIEIVGTDIDTEILTMARQGIYSERSVQYVTPSILSRYFDRLPGNRFQISKDLRSSVRFERVNVVDPAQTKSFRDFDVIFSRNMLIYFDDASRRMAADAYFDSLRPGGYVCLAASESMTRISSLFKPMSFPSATVYQRPL
jgi:chemotaxis protein methyltransferase CheR